MKKPGGKKAEPDSLVIAETSTSTWHYHLRRVGRDGKLYPTGGAPPALCGVALGWDTPIPLDAWGSKSHIPQHWCLDCATVANDEATRATVLPALDIAKKGVKVDGWVATSGFKRTGTLEGRPRHKTAGAAAKAALEDIRVYEDVKLEDGSRFYVGRVWRSTSAASGAFTEVMVLGGLVEYELVDGKVRKSRPTVAGKRP